MAGVEHVVSLGIADPARLGVIGHSAGAFRTNWIVRLQQRWMDGSAELPRRAGWRILAGRIERGSVKDLDAAATLARIECELPSAPYRVQEGINYCLFRIGVHLPAHRAEAIAVGERLGRWDPRPVPSLSPAGDSLVAAHQARTVPWSIRQD